MSLKRISFDAASVKVPGEVAAFLHAVDGVVEAHRTSTPMSLRGFVPSDYSLVYACLKSLRDSNLLCGDRFCEWGSGVGVITILAAMVGFESCGIEYDEKLCEVAEAMSDEFSIPVKFVPGSFVPEGVEDLIDVAFTTQEGELSLYPDADEAYDELGYAIDDFDLIFTYPWPNDVELTLAIFDRCAARGALILAYHADGSIALHRKS
jgi:Histone methylation protein DOT1